MSLLFDMNDHLDRSFGMMKKMTNRLAFFYVLLEILTAPQMLNGLPMLIRLAYQTCSTDAQWTSDALSDLLIFNHSWDILLFLQDLGMNIFLKYL